MLHFSMALCLTGQVNLQTYSRAICLVACCLWARGAGWPTHTGHACAAQRPMGHAHAAQRPPDPIECGLALQMHLIVFAYAGHSRALRSDPSMERESRFN